jgi:hypothetical protein
VDDGVCGRPWMHVFVCGQEWSGVGSSGGSTAQGRPTRRVAGRPGGMGRSKRRGRADPRPGLHLASLDHTHERL